MVAIGKERVLDSEYFFKLSPDLLCIAGYDGYFKRVNPAVSNLLGYTQEELLSKPIDDFMYEEDIALTRKYRKKLTLGSPLLNYENRYVTKSGDIVWLAWTSMPLEDKQLIYAIAKNITYKKKLEEERNILLANLSRMNQHLKQLTYTTSHDLRSPVSSLISAFDLIDRSSIQNEETLELLDILKSAAEGLKLSLNNYVDVLTNSDELTIPIEELDLDETVKRIEYSIRALIHHSSTTIKTDFSVFDTINFNKAYLASIFLNLITNSIKYANPLHSPIITITTHIEDGKRQLIYTDNGIGFEMDKVQDKLFGLHQKFGNHSDSKGIGLYLVHSHITNLGGKICVQSERNKGTTFTITLKD